ncbi:MAG TPA: sulfatase-like hydrolase/transferase [Vicinamibacterales bacterium]|nr:sulfatase-like hydrolase/transferase [Vicinamibacterales bacterium]
MPGRSRARTRRWQATLIITLVFSAAVGAAAVGWWYARESPPHQGPIVLLAVDGLSSSALTAYGARTSAAPAIDALAADSVVFERAYIHSPAMLPAYTSLLTGQLPFDHGVRDEAGFALKTDTRTLPELLRSRGFSTGAAVSSFLLRKATGLSRGFAFYGGELGQDNQDRALVERTGAATFETAAQWLKQQGGQRFMLFMEVPADGADAVAAGLIDLLKERRLYEKATIIVVGGRGAGFATGRLDDDALRIPLIVKQPDLDGAGRRVRAPVQHVDVLPTVLDLVRAPIPGGLRGRSLRPVLDDSDETVPVRPLYAESLAAWYRFGGRPSYALTSDGARLVRDGDDTLVPLDGADIPNPTPVVHDAAALSAELDRLLDKRTLAPAAALSTLDAELFARLGILMASSDLPDTVATALPADQAALLDQHRRAAGLVGGRQFGAAIAGLRDMARANPQVPALQLQLGTLLERAGRLEEAVAVFAEADRTWPDRVPVTLALSHALARAGKLDQAQQKADAAVALTEGGTPADRAAALEAAARIAIDRRDVAAAERSAQARFDLDGSRALRQFVRGRELLDGGHFEEAHAALLEASRGNGEADSVLPGLHLALGETLLHLEQPADAEGEFKEEVRLFPLDPRAYVSLALLYHSTDREDDAAQVIEELLQALPTPEGSSAAARAWTAIGNRERADAVRADARARFKGDPSLNLLGRGRP